MNTQFNVNDKVIHKREGLSQIVSTATISDKEYFLLKAVRGDGEMIYVPIDGCENIIRDIMTSKEANEIFKFMRSVILEINANTKQRRDAYKKMLNTGEIKDIAYLAMQLHLYNLIGGNGKLGPMDIEMLKRARNMLLDELMETFKKPADKIEAFVDKKVG